MKTKEVNQLKRDRRQYLADLRLIKQWNQRLAAEGVSMEKGRSEKVIYAGSLNDLTVIEKYDKKK